MKAKFIGILILFPYLLSAQWVSIESGTNENLQDVFFSNEQVGYIVGNYGTVLKTEDSGLSWTQTYSDSSLNFKSVFFKDIQTGFAVSNKLYKTIDGGYSWTSIFSDSAESILEVYFVDSLIGYLGSENRIYKTTDGGDVWAELGPNVSGSFRSIHFPTKQTGYFVGGADFSNVLYKTTDGGNTLTPITNGFQSIKEEVFFISESIGFLCGWYSGLLAKTEDGGQSWVNINTTQENQCKSIFFAENGVGFYVESSGLYTKIHKSVDNGTTWSIDFIDSTHWLNALNVTENTFSIAVGDYGKIYRNGDILALESEKIVQELNLYPNPSKEILKINLSPKQMASLHFRIRNAIGQLVAEGNFISQEIDISSLSQGIYTLEVIHEKHIEKLFRFTKI